MPGGEYLTDAIVVVVVVGRSAAASGDQLLVARRRRPGRRRRCQAVLRAISRSSCSPSPSSPHRCDSANYRNPPLSKTLAAGGPIAAAANAAKHALLVD
ncbi:hypothetical protein Q1695_004480 [Nippostrongylus brasiliensis]|nr:hypothetical protein Q1695_004480 [Nippostrongylus brasiliensis]